MFSTVIQINISMYVGNATSSAAEKSDGGMGKRRMGVVEIAFGVSLWIFSIHQNFVV